MKKIKLYIYLVIISFFTVGMYFYFSRGISEISISTIQTILFWGILGAISETFLIVLPSGATTSVGMAVYLSCLIVEGPIYAIIAATCAHLFKMPVIQNKRINIFRISFSATLFNICSHTIFIGAMGLLYEHFVSARAEFTEKAIVGLIVLVVSELLSIMLIIMYYYFMDGYTNIPLIRSFIGSLPSTLAVGALGMLLVFGAESGKMIVVIFFVPLLLARYSFKLYFDSQRSSQETIEALNEALFVRDAYTAGHTTRVEEYAILLAKATNYTAKDLETLTRAAKLHDIGKIGVPDGILNKPGKLTQEEYFQIRDHAAMGHKILSNVDSLKKVAEVVRHHHERPDGKGYPDGLKDNEIPRDSAILAIADTFDAMTSDRPYRKALSKEQALAELEKYKGTQFNQFLAEVFISIMKEYDSRKPQEVVAITEVAKHEHVDEKKVASTTLSKAVARHKKETVRLAEEVAE